MIKYTTEDQFTEEQKQLIKNLVIFARYTDDTMKEHLQVGTFEDFKDFARFAYSYNDCTGIDVIEFKYQDLRNPKEWHEVKVENEWHGYTNWIECTIGDLVISQASEKNH